jgi:hypothetical protein
MFTAWFKKREKGARFFGFIPTFQYVSQVILLKQKAARGGHFNKKIN